MKKLIIAIVLIFGAVSAHAQADSLARTMNGFYKWNGEQFFRDTLWADTSMFNEATGLQLAIDTVGSAASGYYKIVTSIGGAGNVEGTGTPLQYSYFIEADSITSSAALSIDTATGRPNFADVASFRDDGRMRFFDTDSIRFSIDTLAIKLNEQRPTDFFIFDTSDTAFTADVSARRVGINAGLSDLGAALTIEAAASDSLLKFVEPNLVAGANTPSFNTAPTSGQIRWLGIIIEVSGTEQVAYFPVLLTP